MAQSFWECSGESRELFSSNQDVIGVGLSNVSVFRMADVIHNTGSYICLASLSRPYGGEDLMAAMKRAISLC